MGSMPITSGTRFDRYEILTHLGSGGMAEVYLARDSRLERKIAIKLLPAEFTRDQARLHRFETEAKAASALNHPNIITIHEIGESDSRHFITTEFIEGRTLRQIISGGKLGSLAAIDIASQIASALAAAHQAGIVHRDIKPENVMIRPDGIVKVLDFGLAKLTERVAPETDAEARTVALMDTDPGMVLGTATYMSPEQVRALKVDARTDVFSLGVVIYEMLTGQTPFEGPSAADVMSRVLNREASPLSSYSNNVPFELQRIVSKALRKDREERYQTIKDMLLDLKSLKRELEATSTLAYSTLPIAGDNSRLAVNYDTSVFPNAAPADLPITGPKKSFSTSSAEYIAHHIKHHKRGFLLSLVVLVAVASSIVLFTRNDHMIDSIAVMPFANKSDDSDTQSLIDAITDRIINNLLKLPNLKVKRGNTVLKDSSAQNDIGKIGKDLDVHAVLMGNISKRGEILSINVELVDARDNTILWNEIYSRKISDLMLIQQEISRDVSDKLRLKLSGEEKKRQEADQLYVKGRNAWSKRTEPDIVEGLNHFEAAVKLDPTYAPAYAGIADCYSMLFNYSFRPHKTVFEKAREAADKALSLDDDLAEAHAARAFIYFQLEWNWIDAKSEFSRAIDIMEKQKSDSGPKSYYGTALQWYSSLLMATGNPGEALEVAKRAKEIEPLSLIVSSQLGLINYYAHRYDQTINETNQILKLDPNFFAAHRYKALASESLGKFDQAIEEFKKIVPLSRGSVLLKAELGHAYAVAGYRNEALQILNELEQISSSQQRYISAFHPALIYAGLGEKDRAIDYLNKAYDEHAERLIFLKVDPRFDSLRTDARFKDILERMRLVP